MGWEIRYIVSAYEKLLLCVSNSDVYDKQQLHRYKLYAKTILMKLCSTYFY